MTGSHIMANGCVIGDNERVTCLFNGDSLSVNMYMKIKNLFHL